jgi:hypothetical protein
VADGESAFSQHQPEARAVKRLLALVVGVAFAAGLTGLAQGQAPTATKEEKTGKAAETKKPVARNVNGTVKAAAADSLVVSGKVKGQDAEWTFAIEPRTRFRKAGKDIAATDLGAGDAVHVRYHAEGNRNVADTVVVRTAKKVPPPARDGAKR